MFGMLDYRAHKLYLLVFGIPLFLLRWLTILGIPFMAYMVGKNYASSWIGVLLISLFAYLAISFLTEILVYAVGKFIEFTFSLFIDIIPANGRTKEEARLVTWNGEKAISLLALGHISPKDWSDEMIEDVTKGFFNWFFREDVMKRLNFIKEFHQTHQDYVANSWNNEKLLKANNLAIPIIEQITCNPIFRGWVISGLFFLYLIFMQPTI